jgi:tetratricopeptide (TPR) repeat protein
MKPYMRPVVMGLSLLLLAVGGLTGQVVERAAPAVEDIAGEVVGEVVGDAGPAADGVYVQDSTAALDQFALAERLVSLGEYDKAAEVYQETIAEAGDGLVASRRGEDGSIYQYRRVAEAVNDRLAGWPEAGRDVYRARFGLDARTALEQALSMPIGSAERDAQLVKVIDRFFLTDAAVAAAIELADRHLARGSFRTAARVTGRLLDRRTDLGERTFDATPARAALLLRAGLALHLSGDVEAAQRRVAELADSFPLATGPVAGERRVLAQVARAVVDQERPVAQADGAGDPPDDTWPMLGGAAHRGRIAAAAPGRMAPLFSVGFPDLDPPGAASQRFERQRDRGRAGRRLAGIMPVIAGDVAYWSDNVRVYALDLDTRLPPPGWLQTHATAKGPASVIGAYALPSGGWVTPFGAALAPVVDQDRVYAILGRRDDPLAEQMGNRQTVEPLLVALDRETGRELWSTSAKSASVREDDPPRLAGIEGEQPSVTFAGSPVVEGGVVWVMATTDPRRSGQFEQAYLLGFDAEAGHLRFITYLATASQDRLRRQRSVARGSPDPIPSAADGVVYAPTGRGVLAAVSAVDGRVLWVNLYGRLPAAERAGLDQQRQFGRRVGTAEIAGRRGSISLLPFHAATPIVAGGRVFYRPPDAPAILIYDAGDGRRLGRIPTQVPTEVSHYEPVEALLAVDGDRLFAFGQRSVFCLRWPNLIEATERGDYEDLEPEAWAFWATKYYPTQGDGRGVEAGIVGRPAVTKTHVLVPLPDELAAIRIDTGNRDDTRLGEARRWTALPPVAPFGTFAPASTGVAPEDDDGRARAVAGNVVAVGDRVLIAGQQALAVFADRDAIRARLTARRAAAPQDPEPILTLAAIEGATGEWEQAVALIRDAADLPGGRSPAFDTALSIARARGEPEVADALLSLAEAYADTPGEQVRVRFVAVDRASLVGGDAQRIALLQEVLIDPEWRQVPATAQGDVVSDLRTAGEVARLRIGELVEARPALRRQLRDRARTALEAAGDDPIRLREVADAFPGTPAAVDALRSLVATTGADRDARRAVLHDLLRALRSVRMNFEDIDADESARTHLALAELDAQDGPRLPQAAAHARRAEYLAEGADLADAAGSLAMTLTRRALDADADAAPVMNVGLDPSADVFAANPSAVVDGIDTLLPTPRWARNDTRLLATTTGGAVEVFRFGDPEPVASLDVPDALSPGAAAWFDDALLLWGEGGVAGFDDDGDLRWHVDPDALVPDEIRGIRVAAIDDGIDPVRPDLNPRLEAVLARLRLDDANEGTRERAREVIAALRRAVSEGELQVGERPDRSTMYALPGNRTFLLHQGNNVTLRDRENGFAATIGLHDAPVTPVRIAASNRGAGGEGGGSATRLGDERVLLAAPVPQGVVVVTRETMALVTSGGEVSWSTRLPALPEGRPMALSAAGESAAVELFGRDGSALVIAFDLMDGSRLAWRTFDRTRPLISFAVLPGNRLAVVAPRRIGLIDLDDPAQRAGGAAATVTSPARGGGAGFLPATPRRADDPALLPTAMRWLGDAADRRLFAVGSDLIVYADPLNTARRDAMVIDLTTGAVAQVRDRVSAVDVPAVLIGGEHEPDQVNPDALPWQLAQQLRREEVRQQERREQDLLTGPTDLPGERARAWGSRVYTVGRRGINAHDLSAPDGSIGPHWWRSNGLIARRIDPAVVLDVVAGRDMLLAVESFGTPAVGADAPVLPIRLTAFSRALVQGPGYESGLLHPPTPVGQGHAGLDGNPVAWRPMTDGIALLDDRQRLVFLPGAGN